MVRIVERRVGLYCLHVYRPKRALSSNKSKKFAFLSARARNPTLIRFRRVHPPWIQAESGACMIFLLSGSALGALIRRFVSVRANRLREDGSAPESARLQSGPICDAALETPGFAVTTAVAESARIAARSERARPWSGCRPKKWPHMVRIVEMRVGLCCVHV